MPSPPPIPQSLHRSSLPQRSSSRPLQGTPFASPVWPWACRPPLSPGGSTGAISPPAAGRPALVEPQLLPVPPSKLQGVLRSSCAYRVSFASENGRGTLVIQDVKEADQGAYTCEAINARGMVFGIPDGVLSLTPGQGELQEEEEQSWRMAPLCPRWDLLRMKRPSPASRFLNLPSLHHLGPCPERHFHVEGTGQCLPCFCFGVAKSCRSTGRYRQQIHLRFDEHNNFKGEPVGQFPPPKDRTGWSSPSSPLTTSACSIPLYSQG